MTHLTSFFSFRKQNTWKKTGVSGLGGCGLLFTNPRLVLRDTEYSFPDSGITLAFDFAHSGMESRRELFVAVAAEQGIGSSRVSVMSSRVLFAAVLEQGVFSMDPSKPGGGGLGKG